MNANIDVHIRRLIAEFPGYGVKRIAKLQSHCSSMTFSDKSRYGIIFQQVTQKGGESGMNYIKILQNANNHSKDRLIHIFLDNFHQGGKCSAQIASHQAELRREKNFLIKNLYLFHPYRLTI